MCVSWSTSWATLTSTPLIADRKSGCVTEADMSVVCTWVGAGASGATSVVDVGWSVASGWRRVFMFFVDVHTIELRSRSPDRRSLKCRGHFATAQCRCPSTRVTSAFLYGGWVRLLLTSLRAQTWGWSSGHVNVVIYRGSGSV